jgi:hypothetical protein
MNSKVQTYLNLILFYATVTPHFVASAAAVAATAAVVPPI